MNTDGHGPVDGSDLRFVYASGVVFGGVAIVLAELLVPGTEFVSALSRGTIFLALGVTVGFFRPLGRWHWGVALAIPFVVLFSIHVAASVSTGHVHVTLWRHDVPLLVGVVVGSTVGALVGARISPMARHAP